MKGNFTFVSYSFLYIHMHTCIKRKSTETGIKKDTEEEDVDVGKIR